jgi:ribonucleoside-triphosphate reductase
VEGTPTEVYSRIVGYYRSVRNWNKGKREEYKERKLFVPACLSSSYAGREKSETLPRHNVYDGTGSKSLQKEDAADTKLLLFVRASCPACPSAKDAAFKLGIPVDLVNADTDEGFAEAAKRQVMSTPTAIFLGKDGIEIGRARNAAEIRDFAAEIKDCAGEIASLSAVKTESFAEQAVSF